MRVSHPYIIHGVDEERPSLTPRQHRDVPHEALARRTSPPPSGLLAIVKRMASCRDVTEGTVA
ncbi:hypothetical protein LR48_Vigan06g068300 [Vigna angularis]|uniref:Uncharacterized protein n=1 Tax=Phaseolus angularis TaxID=3914 RepID=A0A0L9US03_PHAAN|nr:hypothetical protein LR48_Vigan06g068300 [Vigna angularis]